MSATEIKNLLRERVEELAQYLFPAGRREGVHWCVGDVTGAPGKSFKICIAGEKAGLWGDFADSEKHSRSLLDLWIKARNADFKTALRDAADWLGEPLNRHTEHASKTRSASTFRTLDQGIASMERQLNMCATRCDPYHDHKRNERFVVVRFDRAAEKQFRPFSRNGSGWIAKDPPGKLPLFRLPELVARSSERVFIVEGEKCVCELETLGLLVTTSAHGAKSAHKTDWEPLVGREAVILPDNGNEGRIYAQAVAGILSRLRQPSTVRIIDLPDLPPKGDCADWLERRDAQTPEDIRAELETLIVQSEKAENAPSKTESFGYFDAGRNCYWIRDDRGDWISLNETQFKRMLRRQGVSPKTLENAFVSPLDLRLIAIYSKNSTCIMLDL